MEKRLRRSSMPDTRAWIGVERSTGRPEFGWEGRQAHWSRRSDRPVRSAA